MRNWAQEYKKSEIADDSDDDKKMFKAEARAKAHSKSLAARSRTAVLGFAPRKASVAQESGSNHSDERYSGLRRISTVDSHNRVRPGNCFQCGKPGHWRAQCPTLQPKINKSFLLEQNEPGVVDSYISYDYLDVDNDVHFPCLGADPSCVE